MRLAAVVLMSAALAAGCSEPEYDASSPQAALDSMHAMIVDERPELLGTLIHIEPRDLTFDDGVTEASAIEDVIDKTGDMAGRLFRIAARLRERYPNDVARAFAEEGSIHPHLQSAFVQFMVDPLGLLDEQRSRIAVEDLGDGTAAVLIDGQPAFGFGLQMRQISGVWKIDVPIDLLRDYRPNTRHEWSVLASLMLSLENALIDFERELDDGAFRDLAHASQRAGRLLTERVIVQALIYHNMKKSVSSTNNGTSTGKL
jgi:hypothetical protein